MIKKIIKSKGNKLYIKLKGYNNSFNRWIGKKIPPVFSLPIWSFLNWDKI